MALAWYVVQVATNMEDKVQGIITVNIAKKIEAYVDAHNHAKAKEIKDAFGIDHALTHHSDIEDFLKKHTVLVPKEKVEEVKNGKKTQTDRKIFPGYVLVQMDYNDELGLLIRKTPRVAGFVGVAKDSKPVPITKKEVDQILNQVEQSKEKAVHKFDFEPGEKVRITDGPFLDFNAIIDEVMYAKTKLRVNVQIFGRETSVELDFGQVEKV